MSSAEPHTEVELVTLESLIPYSNNPKEHPDEQVRAIASSIKNYGWDQPIVVDEENEIIKGHGRMQAAELLDLDEVPVIQRDDLSDAEKRAARIADNKTAESSWDDDLLMTELDVLDDIPEIDMDSIGFDDQELDDLLAGVGENGEAGVEYTDKIETPVYEPSGPKPALTDLYDTDRYEELNQRINEVDVPDDLREFLQLAAQRHVLFDYEQIAEFYAHADADVQELMEALTLVIVDYDQAVEQGFVDFAEGLTEGVSND